MLVVVHDHEIIPRFVRWLSGYQRQVRHFASGERKLDSSVIVKSSQQLFSDLAVNE
jgi:hypothetical protein